MSARRWIFFAVVIGFAARLAISFAATDTLRDDATYYVPAALDLAAGHGYLLHGLPTAYWPIGYPAFLGLVFRAFGPGLLAARWAQVGISTASILAAGLIARRLYRRDEPACVVAWLMALSPAQMTYPSVMLGEVVFTGAVLAGALFLLSGSWWQRTILAGAGWAAAALVRPVALPLPLVIILLGLPASPARKMATVIAIYGMIAVACVPWMLRNERVLHHPVWISTNAGVNLWMGNHAGATGAYDLTPAMEAASRSIGNEVAFDAYARRQALAFMRQHPGEALELFAKKVAILWSPDHTGGDAVFMETRSPGRRTFAVLADLFHWLVLVMFVYAVVSKRPRIGLPLAILACFTLIYAVSVASPRYLFPAMPWLMIALASLAVPSGMRTGPAVQRSAAN